MSNPQIPTKMKLLFGELDITPRVEERLEELGYTVADLQEAVINHKSDCDGQPSVYVGTYGKYNDGSLCGLWIDLSTFNDFDFYRLLQGDPRRRGRPGADGPGLRGIPPPVVQRGLHVGGRLRQYHRIFGVVRQVQSGGRR